MADRGRPRKDVARSNILLRIPTDLIAQVDTFKESLEAERGGFAINRTDLLVRLIEAGLATLTQARQPPPPPPPAPVAPQKRRPKRRTDAVSPELLRTIAQARQHHAELTLEAFGEHLFQQRIYRSRGRDGTAKPASKSLIHKWLAEARAAGLLS
jgi:hypothetical protein